MRPKYYDGDVLSFLIHDENGEEKEFAGYVCVVNQNGTFESDNVSYDIKVKDEEGKGTLFKHIPEENIIRRNSSILRDNVQNHFLFRSSGSHVLRDSCSVLTKYHDAPQNELIRFTREMNAILQCGTCAGALLLVKQIRHRFMTKENRFLLLSGNVLCSEVAYLYNGKTGFSPYEREYDERLCFSADYDRMPVMNLLCAPGTGDMIVDYIISESGLSLRPLVSIEKKNGIIFVCIGNPDAPGSSTVRFSIIDEPLIEMVEKACESNKDGISERFEVMNNYSKFLYDTDFENKGSNSEEFDRSIIKLFKERIIAAQNLERYIDPEVLANLEDFVGEYDGSFAGLTRLVSMIDGGVGIYHYGKNSAFTTRDELFSLLLSYGMEERAAYYVTDQTRKGRGDTKEVVRILSESGSVPQDLMEACAGVTYLTTRAETELIASLMWRLARIVRADRN